MLRLKTFGCLMLEDELNAALPLHRRRLALLVLLARAGDRGLTRDKIVGFLWGESPSDKARHSLEQTLYSLRRQLGQELFEGTALLRLNPSIVGDDAADFEAALRRDALSEAASLYRGPFIDGFYLDQAGEFEEWAERERSHLAGRYSVALEQLAQRETAARNPTMAVHWWRMLQATDPMSARATLGLMRALTAAGDRPAALSTAQTYQASIRDELASAPDAAVLALAKELRNDLAPPVAEPPLEPVRPTTATVTPATKASEPPRPRRSKRLILTLSLLILVSVILTLRQQIGGAASKPDTRARGIAIVPFRVSGPDSSLQYLHEGIVDLLGSRLSDGGTAINPSITLDAWHKVTSESGSGQEVGARLARVVGATEFLEGEVAGGTGEVALSGRLRSMADGRLLAQASVRGPADSVLTLMDRLVAELLVGRAGERSDRVDRLSSTPLPALRAYLAGREAYRRGENAEAVADYSHALDLDSTFTLAGLELAAATGWVFTWAATRDSLIKAYHLPLDRGGIRQSLPFQRSWVRGIETAWRGRMRLSSSDQAYLTAIRGGLYPQAELARDRLWDWEHAVEAAPDRADAWYRLGYILLYQGVALGFGDALQRAAATFRHSLELDSGFVQPRAALLEIAARRGDTTEIRRLGTEYLAHHPLGQEADYIRWHIAAALQDQAALRTIKERFDSLDLQTLDRIQWTSQVEGIDLDGAQQAMELIVRRAGETDERIFALFLANMLALNRGRPNEALRIAKAQAAAEQEMGGYWHYRLVYALYWDSDTVAGREAVNTFEPGAARALSLPGVVGDAGGSVVWDVVQWHLWRSDTVNARRAVRGLGSESGWGSLTAAILADLERSPDAARLLAKVDTLTLRGCCTFPHYSNIILARLHERVGDLSGALEAIRREEGFYSPEYLSSALLEEGRLATLTGDRPGAIKAYRHFLALRSAPEPELQAEADHIRAELERLESAP